MNKQAPFLLVAFFSLVLTACDGGTSTTLDVGKEVAAEADTGDAVETNDGAAPDSADPVDTTASETAGADASTTDAASTDDVATDAAETGADAADGEADGASSDVAAADIATTDASDAVEDSSGPDANAGDVAEADSQVEDGGTADVTPSCEAAACAASAPVCHTAACVDGVCSVTPLADGKLCDDGNVCTANDSCKAGVCAGPIIVCACQTDAECKGKTPGGLCAGAEICDPTLHKCVNDPKTKVVCPTPQNVCMTSACDSKTGLCVESAVSGSKTCSGPDPCLAVGTCSNGSCVQSVNLCECKADPECDAKKGVNPCIGKRYCDTSKAPYRCRVDTSTAVVCPTPAACKPSSCDPKTGQCITSVALNGVSCSTEQACNAIGTCIGGSCSPLGPTVCACKVAADCDDGSACTTDSCDQGACKHTPTNEGGSCKDGDGCYLAGVCKAGSCEGGSERLWGLTVGEQGQDAFYGVRTIGGTDAILLRCTQGWALEPTACYVTRHDVGGKQLWSASVLGTPSGAKPALVPMGDATVVQTGRSFAQVGADGGMNWTAQPAGVGIRFFGLAPSLTAGSVIAALKQAKPNVGVTSTVGLIELDSKGVITQQVEALAADKKPTVSNVATASDGYLFVGFEQGTEAVSWLLKVDAKGKELWQSTGFSSSKLNEAVAVLPNGDIWVGGAGVQRLNSLGEKLPVAPNSLAIKDIRVILPLADGSVVIAGSTQGAAAVQRIAPDLSGRPARSFYGTEGDAFLAAAVATDQTLLVAGIEVTVGKGYGDAVAMRLDAFGNQGCAGSGPCFAKGPTACDDGAPCTADDCTGAKGCSYVAAAKGTPCGSGLACNSQGGCQAP